jgi:transcriptional regulator with XRE-family HTH domain
MWLDNIKELKKTTGMTVKQIADKTKLPERTVARIFSGDTDNPYVDTLHRIVTALGGSLDDILADTKVVVATETLVEVKETLAEVEGAANVMEAERDLVKIENERLKLENANMATELQILKRELQHKDELLELHKFYSKFIPNN